MAAQELTKTVLKDNSALKAYYRFESGALTTDSAGANTLTAISDPALGTGVYGGCADFDGDDCYSIVDHADLKPTTFSVGLWFKTSASGVTDGLYQSNRYDGGANVYGFLIFIASADNKIYFRTGTGTAFDDLATPAAYNDGAWHHVVCTFNGTTKRIYVDGKHVSSVGWANTIGWTGTIYHRIACQNDSGTNINIFTGSLDDVALFNGTALSADQIKELYEGRYQGELRPNQFGTTGALYHLSSTTDASGNNRHLTNNGSVAFTQGKFGNAADLGSGKSLTVAYDVGSTFTLNAWVKRTSEITGEEAIFYNVAGGSTTWNMLNYRKNGSNYELGIGVHVPSVYLNHVWSVLPAGLGTTYHMITYVRTGNDTLLYLDAKYLQTRNYAWSGSGSGSLNIGTSFQDGGGQLYWTGQIDEFMASSTALTAQQIRTMYALGKGMY